MQPLQQQIITEARSWIGTRFHHQGRVKATWQHQGGCDCIGLIIGVAQALALRDKQGKLLHNRDVCGYARQPDGSTLQSQLAEALYPKPLAELKPADVVLFRIKGMPQHVGIISDHPQGGYGVIHAYAPARKVVEHRLDRVWQSRIMRAYHFNQIVILVDNLYR